MFQNESHLKSFLYRSVRNAVINALRSEINLRKRECHFGEQNEEWIEPVQVQIIRSEMYAQIYAAIQQLPDQCQQVIQLSYFEGKSNSEIAEAMRLTLQTVKNHKHRAIKTLKDLISPDALYICCLFSTWIADSN